MAVNVLDPPRTPANLLKSSNPELRRLTIVESVDTIEVRGRVSSFYLKQQAIELLRCASEGRRIVNRVEVGRLEVDD